MAVSLIVEKAVASVEDPELPPHLNSMVYTGNRMDRDFAGYI